MRKLGNILLWSLMLVVSGCTIPEGLGSSEADDNLVARVDDVVLMREDIARDMPQGLKGGDSVTFVRMYIDNWVLNQLKVTRAEEVLSAYEAEIERLVEGYRQSLIMRQLDQYYVDRAIDVEITDKQLSAYYRANMAAFKLDHNMVRGVVVKTPRSFRNTSTLTTALKRVARSGNADEVTALAEKHNLHITDHASEWVSYSDFLSNLPTVRSRSYLDLLDKSGVQQMTTDDALFYFIIVDVARKGSVAPIESVEDDIRRRLYAERRSKIVSEYETELKREGVVMGRVMIADSVMLNSMVLHREDKVSQSDVTEVLDSLSENDIVVDSLDVE